MWSLLATIKQDGDSQNAKTVVHKPMGDVTCTLVNSGHPYVLLPHTIQLKIMLLWNLYS